MMRLMLLIITLKYYYIEGLVYPTSSVFQITASLAAPIELPGRKLYWDWGFQMNYDFPSSLKQFYSVPIWPGFFNDRKRRNIDFQQDTNSTDWLEADAKYGSGYGNVELEKHPSDFTAGELYHSLENILVSYGFHETCLLRSVCEMAYHPFDDEEQNILTEILTFILTPSLHEAFAPAESLYREVYEEAERRGFLHYNCADLYYECKQDLLTSITRVVTNHRHDYNYDN